MKFSYRHYLVFVLLIAAALFVHLHEDLAVPVNQPLENIPVQLGQWRMIDQSQFDEETLSVLKPTDYLVRVYRNTSGATISFYLGYHGGGSDSGPIHSPKHCLPGGGWAVVDETTKQLSVGDAQISVVQAVYQKDRINNLFIYWYQTRGRTINNEYELKLFEVVNSIFYNRRDSAFIRISAPLAEDKEQARRLGEQFIADFYPAIKAVLPL